MSTAQKRKFKWATFTIFPLLLIIAALVPIYLSVSSQAEATNESDWTKVKGYIASYITNQYDPGEEGEAGYLIAPATLNSRINSLSDTAILGEGDDAATAPVLIDNLGTNTTWIPGTSERCQWNTGTGSAGYSANCFDSGMIDRVKAKVDAHAAAGFSTDIVDYCVSGKTEAPTTGAWGYIAQTGGLSSSGSIVNVYGLKYGRNGWTNTAVSYTRTGAIGPATAAATFTPPTVNAASTNCNSTVSDAELVRCQAQQSIYNGAINGMTGGSVGNGQAPGGTAPAATLNAGAVIDTRSGTPGNTVSSVTTYQLPIETLFTTGLSNIPVPATTVLVGARTPMVGGIVAEGLKMLGYSTATGGFINDGLKMYNSSLSGGWVSDGGGRVALTAVAPDVAAPSITVAPSAGSITGTSATISRTANEPATMKVEYGTSPGVYTNTVNNTVLNATKSVNLTGLSPYTTYYVKVTSYDGQANGTASTEFSFRTLDSSNPTVSNVYPANGATLNNITTLTVTADLGDTGSGIDAAATMVHLDVSNMLMDCPVMTTTRVECNATAGDLALGTHPLDVYAYDLAGNTTINSTSFTVADTIAPSVTYTGPSDNINDNTPTVTGTYSDPAPSSGIASADLSMDGGGSFPYTCSAAGGVVTCNVTPAVADDLKNAVIRLTDGSGNSGTASGWFTVDTSLPTVSSVLPSGWITTTSPATISATLADTGSDINTAAGSISVDGTSLGICNMSPTSISCNTSAENFAQGAHSVVVTAYDLAGNSNTGNGSFSVDSEAPVFSNTVPNGQSGNQNPTISVDYSDLTSGVNTATVSIVVRKASVTETGLSCTPSATAVSCTFDHALTDGTYDVQVLVDDIAGNGGTTSWSFIINTAAPVIDSTSPTGWIGSASPTLEATFHASGTIDSWAMTLDGNPCAGATTGQTSMSCPTSVLTDGQHSGGVTVGVGANTAQTEWLFNVDTTAPSVTNIMQGDYITVNSTTISGDYSDDGSGINASTAMVHVDGSMIMSGCTATSTSISCPKSGLTEGVHTIEIIVDDNIGNRQTGLGSFTVDTLAPNVTNLSPSGLASGSSPTVSGDYSDGGTGIDSGMAQITVDGSALTGCTATGTGISCPTSGLAEGAHNYTVSVYDMAGNTGSSSGSFTIDTVAPTFSNTAPGGWTGDSTPIIAFRINDGTSNTNKALTSVSIDGTPIVMVGNCSQTGTDPVDVSCQAQTLAEGPHTINVSATDNNGNSNSTSWSFDVDLSGPSISNTAPSGAITDSTPTITADISDAGAGVDQASLYVTVDGRGLNSCVWNSGSISCDAGAVSAGTHDVHLEILDQASNLSGDDWQFSLTQQNYYFPWYDNVAANNMKGDWLMISNLGGTAAEVDIYVGDISNAATPVAQYSIAGGNAIAPNEQIYWSSPAPLADGPVRVVSTNGQTLLVSQRVLYKDSFNEVMAATDADIAETEFDFTWYDNDPANGMGGNWIMVANVDTTSSATADVYIGGVSATTMNIPAGGYQYWQAPSTITDGPVQVMSQSGQKLVVSQRVVYKNSFTEVIASGHSTLQPEGFFTWYDNDPANGMNGNWVMASNMGGSTTDIEVYLAEVDAGATPVATFTGVLPGEAVFWSAPTVVTDGPVRVRSTNGQPLMSSQRVLYKNSFEEVQGLTPNQMGTNADFNWYDWQSAGMNGDWILIGNQNASGKEMGITIASTPMVNVGTGTVTFPVNANDTVTPSFTGMRNGPVRASCSSCSVSDKLIISQRVIYKDSFNEVVGRPRG